MKTRTRFPLRGLTCGLALATACAPDVDAPDQAQGADSIVLPDAPPTLTVDTQPPALGLHGHFTPTTAGGAAGELAEYANGLDLAAPGRVAAFDPAAVTPAAPDAFVTAALGDRYSSTPAFGGALAAAEAGTASHLAKIDVGGAGQIEDFIDTLARLNITGAAPEHHRSEPASQLISYGPERARWVSGRTEAQSIGRGFTAPRWTRYQAPALGELRERGARMYCAAREAQRQQGSSPGAMGSQAAFSMSVLGHEVRFLVVEPSAVLDGPERFEQSPRATGAGGAFDGAQAFDVPMVFGVRITPIEGIGLPGLAEMRYPMVYVTGDSERGTLGDLRRSTARGVTINTYNRAWQTVSHADAIASTAQGITVSSGQVPLITFGAVSVFLGVDVDFRLGDVAAAPGRSDVPTGALSAFPGPARTGITWTHGAHGERLFMDGAWRTRPLCTTELCPSYGWDWAVLPEGDPDGTNSSLFQFTSSRLGPMETRLLQDDDHAVEGRTSLSIHGAISGVVGLPRVGPFEANITGTGGLRGTAVLAHVVREAATAEESGGSSIPTTSLVVRPRSTAEATIDPSEFVLHLALDLGLYTIRWDPTILTLEGTTLASYDSEDTHAWPEDGALRIGTGSSWGNPMLRPTVHSHLPQGDDFVSFREDVPTCLTNRTPNAPTPAPRPACPAEGGTPQGHVCVYTQDPRIPAGVCADPLSAATAVATDPAQVQCLVAYYRYLCSPASAHDGTVLSHVVDLASPAAMTDFANVVRACVPAFVPGASDASSGPAAQDFVNHLMPIAPCDEAAHLMSPANMITTSGDPHRAPAVSAAPACAP